MKNTITIWKNEKDRSKAKVVQDEKGGLRFEYVPYMHAPDDSWCSFSLWCEVGEKYKYAFEGFFNEHKISDEPIKYDERPWLADKLA